MITRLAHPMQTTFKGSARSAMEAHNIALRNTATMAAQQATVPQEAPATSFKGGAQAAENSGLNVVA